MSADAHSAFSDEYASTAASLIRSPQQNHRIGRQRQPTTEISLTSSREEPTSVTASGLALAHRRYLVHQHFAADTDQTMAQPETVTAFAHEMQTKVQRTFADQITPLRLAGHLSVLLVAAIILFLSQIKIPDWDLPLDAFGSQAAQAQPQTEEASLPARGWQLSNNPGMASLQRIALPFTIITDKPREALTVYTVQAGDTVLGIAGKYAIQPETIMWANPAIEANPDRLSIGDQLKILPVNGVLHTVRAGDTLASIATKYKVSLEAITGYKANNLEDATVELVAGLELVVPGGTKPFITKQVPSGFGGPAPALAIKGSGNFGWPTNGNITQRYWGGHPAIDIGSWTGAPVKSADGGYVIEAGGGWNGGYGNHVIVDHGNGFVTLYAHLNSIFVRAGESISKGQQIGTVGNTGNSTGPHLHFEIRYQGVQRNPYNYLP